MHFWKINALCTKPPVSNMSVFPLYQKDFFFFFDENNSKFESLALRRIFHLLQIKKKKIMTKNLTLIPGMGIRIF